MPERAPLFASVPALSAADPDVRCAQTRDGVAHAFPSVVAAPRTFRSISTPTDSVFVVSRRGIVVEARSSVQELAEV